MPVPSVMSAACRTSRAAPNRCSAIRATVLSLSTSTGKSEPLAHQVAEGTSSSGR